MATIGGMISYNASGMRAMKYGTTREYVLGLEVVLADGGRLMARHNIQVFSALEVDAIVTICSSCGCAWRHEYARLLADEPEYAAKAAALAAKTYDIAEFLTAVVPLDTAGLGRVEARVTVHDPCHLGRGLGVTKQIRKLLSAIPGVQLVEMKDAGRCCGAGGSFSLAYYDLAREINDRKLEAIAKTGADTIATGCGACRMHIADGLTQRGQPQDVVHTVQLLARAYANGRGAAETATGT